MRPLVAAAAAARRCRCCCCRAAPREWEAAAAAWLRAPSLEEGKRAREREEKGKLFLLNASEK